MFGTILGTTLFKMNTKFLIKERVVTSKSKFHILVLKLHGETLKATPFLVRAHKVSPSPVFCIIKAQMEKYITLIIWSNKKSFVLPVSQMNFVICSHLLMQGPSIAVRIGWERRILIGLNPYSRSLMIWRRIRLLQGLK